MIFDRHVDGPNGPALEIWAKSFGWTLMAMVLPFVCFLCTCGNAVSRHDGALSVAFFVETSIATALVVAWVVVWFRVGRDSTSSDRFRWLRVDAESLELVDRLTRPHRLVGLGARRLHFDLRTGDTQKLRYRDESNREHTIDLPEIEMLNVHQFLSSLGIRSTVVTFPDGVCGCRFCVAPDPDSSAT